MVLASPQRPPNRPADRLRNLIQPVAHEHEQLAEEEEAEKRDGGHHGKGVPVRLARVRVEQVRDLHREIAGDEADGQEEDAQLG